jgi:hypothetical protein
MGIGVISERQEWLIIAAFLDCQLRGGRPRREILAIIWLTTLTEETKTAKGGFIRYALPF